MAKLSVLDIARRLGKSPQIVHEGIKADVYPFAVVIRSADNVGWDYTIFPEKFEKYCRERERSAPSNQEENKTDYTANLINPSRMLTVNEVARRLGKSAQTVCKYIEAGLYPFAEEQKLCGRTQYAIFSREFEEYCGTEQVRKVTVADVAQRLQVDPQAVRVYIQHGLFPFATAIKFPGSTRWDYTIFPAKFEEYCATGGKPFGPFKGLHT